MGCSTLASSQRLNEAFLLHARYIFRISPIPKAPARSPSFAGDLRLAIDIGSFERPSIRQLRRIDSDEIWG
jgi:hypothetical protein